MTTDDDFSDVLSDEDVERAICAGNPPLHWSPQDLMRAVIIATGLPAKVRELKEQLEQQRFAELARAHTYETLEGMRAELEAARRDAERYRWLRAWYLRDGKRAEIDPIGHISQTTASIVDKAIDAAIASGDKQP